MASAPRHTSPRTRSPRSELVHAPHPEPAEREPSRTTSRPSTLAMQSTHALTAMQALLASPPVPTRLTTPARRPRVTSPGPPRAQPTSPRTTAPAARRRPLPSATPRRPRPSPARLNTVRTHFTNALPDNSAPRPLVLSDRCCALPRLAHTVNPDPEPPRPQPTSPQATTPGPDSQQRHRSPCVLT